MAYWWDTRIREIRFHEIRFYEIRFHEIRFHEIHFHEIHFHEISLSRKFHLARRISRVDVSRQNDFFF